MLCKGGLKKLSISKVAESFSASLCDIANQFSSMRCIAVSDIAFNFLALFAPIKDRWTPTENAFFAIYVERVDVECCK